MKTPAPGKKSGKGKNRPTQEDALLSPELFAENVEKLDTLAFLETEEIRSGKDPEYEANPREVVKRRVTLAVKEMLRFAHALNCPDEIARLRDVARRAQQKERISFYPFRDTEDLYYWIISLHVCGRWLEVGEEAGDETLLLNVPSMLARQPSFFLGQWWIRFLVHSYYETGEFKQIERLLWGKRGRGKPIPAKDRIKLRLRNHRIFERMSDLLDQNVTRYRAYQLIAKEEGITPQAVKGLFLRLERGQRKTQSQ